MNSNYIFAIVCTVISFFAGFSGFLWLYKNLINKTPKHKFLQAFTPLYLCLLVLLPILFFITPDQEDFISSITIWNIIIPLLCAGIIFITPLFPHCSRFGEIAVIISAALCTLILPESFLFFNGEIPFWADRCFIILFWSVFCCFYYILNGIDGILTAQSASVGIGLSLLFLFDGTPFLLSLIAMSFTAINGAFLIFNWYPAKLTLNKSGCQALGFLTAWLLLLNGCEGNISCGIIFVAFYITELTEAALKKISLRKKFDNLTTNTNYYQTTLEGGAPYQVGLFIVKLLFVLIILGCFQVYAPNAYSVPILSYIICIWFLSRLRDNNPNLTIRELNQNLIDDIKQNINNFRNFD